MSASTASLRVPTPLSTSTRNNDNNDKETVMKYLKTCGLDTDASSDEKKFDMEDIDDSSMAMLIQLSQQYFDGGNANGQKREEVVEPVLVVEGQEDEKESKNKDKQQSNSVSIVSDEVSSREDGKKSMEAPSHTNEELLFAKQTRFENRDFEKLLAQFSLDTKSFEKTRARKLIKKTNSSPELELSNSKHDTYAQSNDLDNSDDDWQQVLSDKLERNNDQIAACSEQIQSLARLIAQDMVERRQIWDLMQQQQQQQYPHHLNPQMTFQNNQDQTGNDSIHRDHQQPQNDEVFTPGQSFIFTLLETFITYLFFLPRKIINYTQSTRIYRILQLIQTEAKTFRENGQLRNNLFFDFTLICKIVFFCFFLFVRFDAYDESAKRSLASSSSKRAKKELAELQLWQSQRIVILMVSAVIVYFVRTGIWRFIYHITIKDNVVRRVWRDEDLNDERDADVDANHDDGRNGQRRGSRDRDRGRGQPNDGNMEGEQAADADGGDNNPANNNNDDNRNDNNNDPRLIRGLRNTMEYVQGQTFIGGYIDRPIVRDQNEEQPPHLQVPREQILIEKVIDSVKDVVYLFGSFFLSLFPMWHPKPREAPVVVDDNRDEQEQNEHNDNMDGGEEEAEEEN